MVNPFGNISNLMKQAKEMQEKMQKAQQELGAMQITGTAGAGMVQLTINGNGEALSLQIDDAVLREDKKIIQGLMLAAINDANKKLEEKKKSAMSGLMSGMNLPDNFTLPGGDD